MGKIVKYCSNCDEGFAEKFGFCPNCATALQAFEMNPLDVKAAPASIPAAPVAETPEPEILAAPAEPVAKAAPVQEVVEKVAVAPVQVKKGRIVEPTRTVPMTKPVFAQTAAMDADRVSPSLEEEHARYLADGGFYVTVIEEKNVRTRNGLLLGTFGFMVMAMLLGVVISIFGKPLDLGEIGNDSSLASIMDDVPTVVEEEPEKKNNDKGGGGGGGGREEKEEVTQGDLADQSKTPTRPPDAKVFRSDNFELKTPPPQTEGNKTFEKKFDRWGDPNGRFSSFSNGTGSGGGQGSGVGTGQGSGRGTGAGSGTGSGYGGGLGNGNGNGRGDGDGSDGNPPPERPKGVTAGIKILSKPRPGYTDSARQSNIQGTVILRVTFLASGQVGSISPVKGLGSGLTEQAIAAARRISFEPAKVNGVAQSVTKQIEYTFSIY